MKSLLGQLCFLVVAISLCSADNENHVRVVGGTNAVSTVATYMVAIVWKNMENNPYQGYFCAGSLIDEEYVLSAASCFDNPATNQIDITANQISVIVGASDLNATIPNNRKIDVASISIHNEWGPGTGPLSNVAILRLRDNVPNGINPLTVARPQDDAFFATSGNAIVAGWGVKTADSSSGLYSSYLQQATIPIVSNTVCQTQSPRFTLTDRYMCAGSATPVPTTACVGDEGAPLVVMYTYAGTTYPVQIGIMTTVSVTTQPRCNGKYGIYAKTSSTVNYNWMTARAPLLPYPSPSLITTSPISTGLPLNTTISATTGLNSTVTNSSSYLSLSVLALIVYLFV